MGEKWFYARVSTFEQQEDRQALQKQLERGKNAGCIRFYWDIQSRSTEVRDGLQQLIGDLKLTSQEVVSELLVTRIDRIGSSSKLFYGLLEVLRSKGIKLVALDQMIDTESLGGELTIDVLLAASKFEVKMLSSRVAAERKLRMVQRKSHRFAPLGWKVESDRYIKDETWCVSLLDGKRSFRAWELAAFIFQVFDRCGSVRKTCNTLNEMFGVASKVSSRLPKKGHKNLIDGNNLETVDYAPSSKKSYQRYPWASLQWSPSGLLNFLVNPVHCGGTQFDVTKIVSGGRKVKHFDDRSVNWDTHEGIISRQQHEQIKRIIRGNAQNRWAGDERVNPFANLLKCSRCGGSLTRMSGQLNRGGQYVHYFRCTYFPLGRCDAEKSIRSDRLDSQIVDLLLQEATRLAGMVDLETDKQDEPAEVKELRETLSGLEKMAYNLFVEKAMMEIRNQIANILSLHEASTKRNLVVREEITQMFRDRDFWDTRTPEDKKRILTKLVRRIVVDTIRVVRIEFL